MEEGVVGVLVESRIVEVYDGEVGVKVIDFRVKRVSGILEVIFCRDFR